MSEVALTEFSTERCLLDMHYEILFEIFRGLSKGKLFEMTDSLCPKLRDVASDARLWKNVYIKYNPITQKYCVNIAFEKLYSKPWPVKVIDLSGTKIFRMNPQVSSQTNQVVKVTRLDLSIIYEVNNVTLEAILAKYQCTELYLKHYSRVDLRGHIMKISPEAFSKQTSLEVLSLEGLHCRTLDGETRTTTLSRCHLWLKQVLSNCKNLKSLDLGYSYLANIDMLISLVEHLPTSLEKLWLKNLRPNRSFFELLLERIRNLRELELGPKDLESILYTSLSPLCKFKFLETLRLSSNTYGVIADLTVYLKQFPALKRVYVLPYNSFETQKLRTTLESHSIIVDVAKNPEYPRSGDCNLLEVS